MAPSPRFLVLIALAGALIAPSSAGAQTAADTAAIHRAAMDYMEGWYTGNAERMRSAVHPDLAKRIMVAREGSGRVLQQMSAEQLIGATGSGGGSRTPEAQRRAEVRILDLFQNTASVRADMQGWIDYMHLAKADEGRWVIVNVLWEQRRR